MELLVNAEVDGNLTVAAAAAVSFDGGKVSGQATITGGFNLATGTTAEVGGTLYLQGGTALPPRSPAVKRWFVAGW